MTLSSSLIRCGLLTLGATLAGSAAWAVNGTQLGGYGVKNAMMGGASIALPLDAVAAANNPAGMAFVPDTTSLNLQVFDGQSASGYVLPGNRLNNHTTTPSPEGGGNWSWGSDMTFGISMAGSGAGASYKAPALPVPGAADAKAALSTVEIIPTLTWKARPDLAIGIGLNVGVERFKAQGVIVPTPGGPLALPTHGSKTATGAGLRLGMLWQATPEFALGANYKTKTRMSAMQGYRDDLLAYSNGRIDIPSQYGVGVAWRPVPTVTLAADWLRIDWAGIKLMQDPNGFQWRAQPIVRGGVAWALNDTWTLRAGVSANSRQIDESNLNANLLTPSINSRAYTAGVTMRLNPKSDLSVGYELNPKVTLTGTGASAGTTLSSKVQVLMLGYQRAF